MKIRSVESRIFIFEKQTTLFPDPCLSIETPDEFINISFDRNVEFGVTTLKAEWLYKVFNEAIRSTETISFG